MREEQLTLFCEKPSAYLSLHLLCAQKTFILLPCTAPMSVCSGNGLPLHRTIPCIDIDVTEGDEAATHTSESICSSSGTEAEATQCSSSIATHADPAVLRTPPNVVDVDWRCGVSQHGPAAIGFQFSCPSSALGQPLEVSTLQVLPSSDKPPSKPTPPPSIDFDDMESRPTSGHGTTIRECSSTGPTKQLTPPSTLHASADPYYPEQRGGAGLYRQRGIQWSAGHPLSLSPTSRCDYYSCIDYNGMEAHSSQHLMHYSSAEEDEEQPEALAGGRRGTPSMPALHHHYEIYAQDIPASHGLGYIYHHFGSGQPSTARFTSSPCVSVGEEAPRPTSAAAQSGGVPSHSTHYSSSPSTTVTTERFSHWSSMVPRGRYLPPAYYDAAGPRRTSSDTGHDAPTSVGYSDMAEGCYGTSGLYTSPELCVYGEELRTTFAAFIPQEIHNIECLEELETICKGILDRGTAAALQHQQQQCYPERVREDRLDSTTVTEVPSENSEAAATEAVIALDLEGRDLSRHGSVCIVTIATHSVVYIIDMVQLGPAALQRTSSLTKLLESRDVAKLMFDCRADCDALFFLYNVRLQAVCDLQIASCFELFPATRHLPSMKDVFRTLGLFSDDDTTIKNRGRAFFDPKAGGSFDRWEERPLAPILLHYCAVDVKYFFLARMMLWSYVEEACQIGEVRLSLVCSGHFLPFCKGNSLRDFDCI